MPLQLRVRRLLRQVPRREPRQHVLRAELLAAQEASRRAAVGGVAAHSGHVPTRFEEILTKEILEIPKTKMTMRQEIISDKAQDYVSRLYAENEYPCGIRDIESNVMEAFSDGAQWRIAAVWHDARKEVPEKCKPILTERKSGIFSVNISGGNMESCPLSWARWAYISDLIPDRKEGGR